MTTVLLKAPPGVQGTVLGPAGAVITQGADGTATVDVSLVSSLLSQGWQYVSQNSGMAYFNSPPVGTDLTSIVAAAAPTSGTPMTIAAQPKLAAKLNVRGVYSGAVAGLVVNLVGIDGRGNAVSESVNVAGASSTTFVTANAYAKVTSVTPVGTVTNVTTIGVGLSTALALPMSAAFVDLVVYKEVTATAGTAATLADETVGTVDTVAGTIAPTTAADGTKCFYFYYTWTAANP